MKKPQVSIIVPLFNESLVFNELVSRLESVLNSISFSAEVLLVNDGSKDDTALKIEAQCEKDNRFVGVILSRNYGHQIAVTAGMNHAIASQAVMIIDGDLQDPPELISDFYNLINNGNDVVYAIRKNRKEGFLKKTAYKWYYRLQKKISNLEIPIDSGDFCMLSTRVVSHMNNMPEQSRYLRGMRSWVGFKQVGFEYDRDSRAAGESKYSWGQLFKLAFNGIFNFSDFPVKIIIKTGFFTVAISLFYLVYNLYRKIFFNDVPKGFTAVLAVIILFCGVQMLALGFIGEYVLRIYNQVRNRPLFIVDKIIKQKEKEDE